jgi:hypothetical protein
MPTPPIELTPLSTLLPNLNKLVFFFIDPPSFSEGFVWGSLGEVLAWDSRGEVLPSFGEVLA